MPPISPPRRILHDDPLLSDEDVGLLYQIIVRAEQNPDVERLPFRALFAAYDGVLAEHGIDADQNQVCMRFLFKLGNKSLRGESLFEKFENLLQQMGIVLEFDNSGQNNSNVYFGKLQDDTIHEHVDMPQREATTPRVRKRRASFNSMYDIGDEATERSAVRPSSRSSLSRLDVEKTSFMGAEELPNHVTPNRERNSFPDRTQLLAQFLELGQRLVGGLDPSKKEARKQDKGSSVNGDFVPVANHVVDNGHKPADDQDLAGSIELSPSLSDMLRDASAFNMGRRKTTARRILIQWLEKSIRVQQKNKDTEAVAINRDRSILLRQALDVWHGAYQAKSRATRTERFFKHLERRADRARNLYLLTKAFTHWAQLTSDEVSKTSAARQHILRIKYFNAWREITAVNELKAQRFAVKRPFSAWKMKLSRNRNDVSSALDLYNLTLERKFFYNWFWESSYRRATRWYEQCLKRRSLICWLRALRTQREREQDIDNDKTRTSLQLMFQTWYQKTRTVFSLQEQADLFFQKKILKRSLDGLRIETRLSSTARQVSSAVDKRISQEAINRWLLRARMMMQADEMDRMKIMGQAFAEWNDRLRCRALHLRMEERLKVEALYKWVLAKRSGLMQRVREKCIVHEAFTMFVSNARGVFSQLSQREEECRRLRNRELLRSKLACLRRQLGLQFQREKIASEFYSLRIEHESLGVWISKQQHITKLEGRSQHARFYFLATKSIKQWHAASLDSSKRRRLEAYANVRRLTKVNLASNVLTTWRSSTQHITTMEQQAIQVSRDEALRTASGSLSRWHLKTTERQKERQDSDIFYHRQLAYRELVQWFGASNKVRTLENQASKLYSLHVSSLAMAQLRKISLRVFLVRSTVETADAMNERTLRKHFRNIFRHWLEKARTIRAYRGAPGPTVTTINGPIFEDDESNADEREGPERDPTLNLDDLGPIPNLQQATPVPPMPGYLLSPSKRAARARALAQLSTTPTTPLYTPFASRLRAAITGDKRTSIRRRSLGNTVRFVDVPESPLASRRSANRD
ncbi:Sfi1 spindle body domain containing protein [Elaphomyces granulatus]